MTKTPTPIKEKKTEEKLEDKEGSVDSEAPTPAAPAAPVATTAKGTTYATCAEHVTVSVVTKGAKSVQFSEEFTCSDDDEEETLAALAKARPDMIKVV